MPIEFNGAVARFVGECTVEEAMDLCEWLRTAEPRGVDLGACTHLHGALLQTLLAMRPPVVAAPVDGTLCRWIAPMLPAATSRVEDTQSGETAEPDQLLLMEA